MIKMIKTNLTQKGGSMEQEKKRNTGEVTTNECVNEAARIIGDRLVLVSQGKAHFDDDDLMLAAFIEMFLPEALTAAE